MNQEKLNQLFELATGRRKQETKQTISKGSINKATKAKNSFKLFAGSYADPITAWQKWYEDSRKNIDSENIDDVWKFAEDNHPNGKEEARNYLRSSAPASKNPVTAESQLRESLTKSPSWFVQEKLPELNQLGSVVSNQNLIKARQIYANSLQTTLMNLPLTDLDPDVPSEVHINDLLKLELLGSAQTASIVNGRFAISDKSGKIIPAFMLDQPSELAAGASVDPAEMDILSDLVPEVATPIIESALSNARGSLELGNKAASGVALQMLQKGMPVEKWGDAFSLIGNNDIDAGLNGLIENNDYGYEDLIRLSSKAQSMYGDTR